MQSRKGAATRIAAIAANLIGSLFRVEARSNASAGRELTRQLASTNPSFFAPVTPLFGHGTETKGPVPRHPLWPMNHYTTRWHPSARNGEQERARRMRQIARGQLRRENGLAV